MFLPLPSLLPRALLVLRTGTWTKASEGAHFNYSRVSYRRDWCHVLPPEVSFLWKAETEPTLPTILQGRDHCLTWCPHNRRVSEPSKLVETCDHGINI